jgi:hypothetical protein
MANPSKLSLYIAAVTAGGGVRTLVKPKLVLSERVRMFLEEEANLLMLSADLDSGIQKFAGSVKLPASLEVATEHLIYYVAPMASALGLHQRKCDIEVMFNDPAITTVVKHKYLDKWRLNNFSFKYVNKKKEPIPHAAQWATFDSVLRSLNGSVCYNHDDILRGLVGELKPSRRKKNVASIIASGGED